MPNPNEVTVTYQQEVLILTAATLEPGDVVLVTLADDSPGTHQNISRLDRELRGRFPGVQFVIMAGVADVRVQKGRP